MTGINRTILSITGVMCLWILQPPAATSQSQEKIMTYNLLNYDASDTARNTYFRTVINSVRPDILAVQEIIGLNSVNTFRRQVMNAISYSYASAFFIDGPDTDNALFYDSTKFKFIFNTAIPTAYRNLNEFRMLHKATGDTFRIYTCHLKADTGEVNRQRRAAQVDSLRKRTDALPYGSLFITCGDFNMYGSTEYAYQKLLQMNTSDGNFNDPFVMPGIWNASQYAANHTQSTRRRSFGNGATGGLDDRFDIILYSNGIKSDTGRIRYSNGSMIAFGNDGQHYNDSINRPPNLAVTQQVADALELASDHLPVLSGFSFFPSNTQINITLIPEGYYNLFLNLLSIKDTVKVFVRSYSPPYSVIDSAVSVIDSVSFNGIFTFPGIYSGTYFLSVEGRNTIETWSRAGGFTVTAGALNAYEFTSSASQAYGNNMKLIGSRYCLFSGDVNSDGIIDAGDLSLADNDAFVFSIGYIDTDVNGDFTVDASDIQIIDNNAFDLVTAILP